MENTQPNKPIEPIRPTEPVETNVPPVEVKSIPAKKIVFAAVALVLILVGVGGVYVAKQQLGKETDQSLTATPQAPADISPVTVVRVPFEKQTITIAPAVAEKFSITEITNLSAMEQQYGVTFTEGDLAKLEENKFIVKNLLDTNLTPVAVGENGREFVSLYTEVAGSFDYKKRTQANAIFVSSDVLMHLFSILSVDLLKEAENRNIYPQVLAMTQKFYTDASQNIQNARTEDERQEWVTVRNYFAIPYALLSTSIKPITAEDYWNSDRDVSVEQMQADFQQRDVVADSYENAVVFIKNLGLDPESEAKVLADVKMIYDAPVKSLPKILEAEYQNIPGDIQFQIPYSLFKVRGSYTSSSLRRQYFRAMQWYQQVPFFTSSRELTNYAVRIGELLRDNPDLLKQYDSMSSLFGALIGEGDDLDARDYAEAVTKLGTDTRDQQKLKTFLTDSKPQSRIKSLPATYSTVGEVSIADVMDATQGMRFFSQKFIPDSYWTGQLTQGDEQPAVDGMKLPRSVSSLQVMTILGSAFAKSQLPQLPFYLTHQKAIDTRLGELIAEATGWGDSYWQSNQVTSILSTISGLFDWVQKNRSSVPQFMQSPLWDAKTLMTGSAFWTELRHTNILYAKQSFAEKGGGDDDSCDARPIPPPAQGYIEPQPEAYDQLFYTARLLHEEYATRRYELQNLKNLEEYIDLLEIVREYTKLQLENTAYNESTISKSVSWNENCIQNFIAPEASVKRGDVGSMLNANQESVTALSRSEELRLQIVERMRGILPLPIEGPVLPMKDKRAAVVADIHTSDEGIVTEGTGVPRVIFVAVKDANGARLTVGFTYSHYEFLSDTRLTDEEWQDQLYTNEGGDYKITYKPKDSWPVPPVWYQELLGGR